MRQHRRPGQPAKPLLELVVAGSFRRWRHAALLAGAALPESSPFPGQDRVWTELRSLQRLYRNARSLREQEGLARDFAALVDALHSRGKTPHWIAELIAVIPGC